MVKQVVVVVGVRVSLREMNVSLCNVRKSDGKECACVRACMRACVTCILVENQPAR